MVLLSHILALHQLVLVSHLVYFLQLCFALEEASVELLPGVDPRMHLASSGKLKRFQS